MFCPKCGSRAGDDYAFCPECGADLTDAKAAEAEAAKAAHTAPLAAVTGAAQAAHSPVANGTSSQAPVTDDSGQWTWDASAGTWIPTTVAAQAPKTTVTATPDARHATAARPAARRPARPRPAGRRSPLAAIGIALGAVVLVAVLGAGGYFAFGELTRGPAAPTGKPTFGEFAVSAHATDSTNPEPSVQPSADATPTSDQPPATPPPAAVSAARVSTPAQGSAQRTALMNAARATLGTKSQFLVLALFAQGDNAVGHLQTYDTSKAEWAVSWHFGNGKWRATHTMTWAKARSTGGSALKALWHDTPATLVDSLGL